jgi:hypothetical protein
VRLGICPNPNQATLGYAYRIDDGTLSYDLPLAPGFFYEGALLIAVGDAGLPQGARLTNENSDAGGPAPSVTIQSPVGLALVAFTSGELDTLQGDAAASCLSEITTVAPLNFGQLQVYSGAFPKGKTPTFGPFTTRAPCWGTLTMAIPPGP